MKLSGFSDRIIEIAIGMNDGLMIPLALSAGMFAAGISHAQIVEYSLWVLGGCGLLMTLGGWLAGRTGLPTSKGKAGGNSAQPDPVRNEEQSTRAFLQKLDLDEGVQQLAVEDWKKERAEWAGLMSSEMEKINAGGHIRPAWQYGLSIGLSYLVGGLLPIMPYSFLTGFRSFAVSITVTFLALFLLGIVKSLAIGQVWWAEGLRYLLLAVLAVSGSFAAGYFFFQ